MAKSKFYAVRKGLKTGIFDSWDETKDYVTGVQGAEYKSFAFRKDAEDYMKGSSAKEKYSAGASKKKCEMTAYTDGSYNDATKRAGYGVVFVDSAGEVTETIQGSIPSKSHQVDGELFAVLTAITYAIKKRARSIEICYDYEGVEKWANGEWTATKACAVEYVRAVKCLKSFITVKYSKVPAHSGVEHNNRADALAKIGCGM